jgi:purine-cytosine permease-like protein
MTDWNTFLWGVILGSVLLSVLLCISGYVGLKMRIPTAVQYGNIFGQVGARIMNFFLLPAGIIWVAWMSDIAATSVQDIFPAVPYWTVVVAIVAISVFSTIRGVKGMEQSGYIQAPIVLILVLVTIVVILVKGFSKGTLELQMNSENTLSLLDSAVFVVLTWISVIQIFSDFTCGVKSTKDMTIGTSVGYGLLNAVMMFAGGVFAMVCGPEYSMVRGFTAGGIPQILVLVIVLLCSWTFNDRSFYSFGLGASVVLGEKVKSWIPLVVGGIAAAIIATMGVMDYMYPILNVLGCLYAPLLGIYMCKYYVLGGLKECTSDFSKMIKFDWIPFIPWGVGLALGLILTENQSIISFAVSFVIYFVMCKIRDMVKNKK